MIGRRKGGREVTRSRILVRSPEARRREGGMQAIDGSLVELPAKGIYLLPYAILE